MVPTDYTIRKGHRMELVILGSDVEITTRPKKVTYYRVKENRFKIKSSNDNQIEHKKDN